MKGEGAAAVAFGLAVAALGGSLIAWGNWCPVLPSYNSPTAFGIIQVGLGAFLITLGIVLLVADRNDRI